MSDDDNTNAPDSQPAAFPQGSVAFPNASAPTTASSSWLPPKYRAIGQGAQAVGRSVAAGLMAIDKASHELGGSKPAY
jgi:hypothetical protein